jgi:hypothetical protein
MSIMRQKRQKLVVREPNLLGVIRSDGTDVTSYEILENGAGAPLAPESFLPPDEQPLVGGAEIPGSTDDPE